MRFNWIPRMPVLYATIALFVLCAIVQPRSIDGASLKSMLPFAAVLVVAALGQTLVVQQRGIDLSVAGTMTLSAALVSLVPHGNGGLFPAILLALAVGATIGVILGLAVTVFRITPLIATFAMNAVTGGVVLAYSQNQTSYVPPALNHFGVGKTLGVQNLVWTAIALTLVAAFLTSCTSFGRRFSAIGANPVAARAAGMQVMGGQWSAYIIASVSYAGAGILIAGFVNVPDLNVGSSYTMPSIAAVVLGGTLLTGGRGHMIGTAIGALLLSQLNQFVLSVGAPTAVQYIVQGGVIAVAALFQTRLGSTWLTAIRRKRVSRIPAS